MAATLDDVVVALHEVRDVGLRILHLELQRLANEDTQKFPQRSTAAQLAQNILGRIPAPP